MPGNDDSTTSATADAAKFGIPTLEDWQHWTLVMGRAQQMLLEAWADGLAKDGAIGKAAADPLPLLTAGAEAWSKGLEAWGQMLTGFTKAADTRDRRFGSTEWHDNPLFDTIRQSYLAISDQLLGSVEKVEGLDEQRANGCASRRRASSMR